MLRKIKILACNWLDIPVTYGDEFFGEEWLKNWTRLKNVLGDLILTVPAWNKVLDFGCGPGIMIDHMNALGIEYDGLEYSNEAFEVYRSYFGKYPTHYHQKLSDLPKTNFSLFLAFDVLEHMKDHEIREIFKSLSDIPDVMVNISRARALPGHINIKSDEHWIVFFKQMGYLFNEKYTEQLRGKYLQICPNGEDLWHKNHFIFSKTTKVL